jgi:hypothetical protein
MLGLRPSLQVRYIENSNKKIIEMYIKFWYENLKVRNHLVVDGKIILK